MNLILTIVGLVVCAGGIYFRKFFSLLLGLYWGALIGLLIALISAGFWRFDSSDAIPAMVIGAVVLGVLSIINDKICVAINTFVPVFVVAALLLIASDAFDEFAPIAVIAIIISGVVTLVSVRFYDYAFMIITAFTGAFMACMGIYGLSRGAEITEVLFSMIFWGNSGWVGGVLLGTVALGAVGFVVQLHRFGVIRRGEAAGGAPPAQTPAGGFQPSGMAASTGAIHPPAVSQQPAFRPEETAKAQDPAAWQCGCGATNTMAFCSQCGTPKPAPVPFPPAAQAPDPGTWQCGCGAANRHDFCSQCGKPRPAPAVAEPGAWQCGCGAGNNENFCYACGSPRPENQA